MDQRGLGVHHAHAAPATTASSLDDDRVTDGFGRALDHRRVIGQCAFRAWHTRHASLDHGLLGRDLVTHDADGFRRRADKFKAAFFYAFGKISVFAEETITWVDGFGISHLGRSNDGRHAEVALGGWCRTDAH